MAQFKNTNPLNFNPTTPVKFYVSNETYVSGEGNSVKWEELDSNGYKVFYIQWHKLYGDRLIAAESVGAKDVATLRMTYNPVIYKELESKQVLVVKNLDDAAFIEGKPIKSNPNLYEVWGLPDNVLEENKFVELRVRRYEAK